MVSFFKLKRGHDLPKQDRVSGVVDVISSSGFSDFHNEFISDSPGVITGRYGTIGEVFYTDRPYWPLNTTLYVEDFKGNNPKFVYYFLKGFDFNRFNDKSAVPGINRNHIHEELISFPDLNTQNRIAEILSSLDDKIDLLHSQNKTLEEMVETIFLKKIIYGDTKKLEQSFSNYILETIGGEWGKDAQDAEFSVKVSCIRGTDIADMQISLPKRVPIRFVKEKKFNQITPLDGDIIMEISGGTDDQSTGRVIFIDSFNRICFKNPIIFSNFCRLLRPKDPRYCYFLYLYLKYLYKQDEFFNIENGSSGIKNLDYKYLLNNMTFEFPRDENEILNFTEKIQVYFQKIAANNLQVEGLEQVRDLILPRLMNGELKIN